MAVSKETSGQERGANRRRIRDEHVSLNAVFHPPSRTCGVEKKSGLDLVLKSASFVNTLATKWELTTGHTLIVSYSPDDIKPDWIHITEFVGLNWAEVMTGKFSPFALSNDCQINNMFKERNIKCMTYILFLGYLLIIY